MVRPHHLARGRGRRPREPRALRCRPGHGEALLDANDVVSLDQGAAIVARGETHERTPRFGGYLMSTRANSSLYLVLRYRGPARVDGDTLARRRQNNLKPLSLRGCFFDPAL